MTEHDQSTEQPAADAVSGPLLSCAASTRASAPWTSCAASTSTSTPGRVTALVGDNGAGKSTLIKGIAGIHAFDAGEYAFDGKPVTVTAPRTATPSASRSSTRTSRCATTSTSSTTCSSAASSPSAAALDEDDHGDARQGDPRRALGPHAAARCAPTSPACPADSARPSRSRAPCCGTPSIVILDEPTAALGVAQTEQVLNLVRRLADRGLGVVLISHNLNDVFAGRRRHRGALPRPAGRPGRTPRTSPTARSSSSSPPAAPATSGCPPATARTDETEARADDRHHHPAGAERHDRHAAAETPAAVDDRAATTSPACAAATSARCRPPRPGRAGRRLHGRCGPTTFTNAFNFANLINQSRGGHRHRDGPGLRAAARRDRPVGRLHRRQLPPRSWAS